MVHLPSIPELHLNENSDGLPFLSPVNNGGCATAAGKEFGQIFDSPLDGPNKRELSNHVSETKKKNEETLPLTRGEN